MASCGLHWAGLGWLGSRFFALVNYNNQQVRTKYPQKSHATLASTMQRMCNTAPLLTAAASLPYLL